MKIVKSYRDDNYARFISHKLFKEKANIEFGLGEDGELYWKGNISGYGSGGFWLGMENKVHSISLPLSKIIEIINKFNTLPFVDSGLVEERYIIKLKEKI